MAEYWKSTFCSTYVRDTGLERRNHESTGRHQSAIQRNLRNLHRDTERQDREKQRAKDEVARLNGVVSGNPSQSSSSSMQSTGGLSKSGGLKAATGGGQRQVTAEERKRQLAQLAAMGVAVPEDYRREVAMAGEWETLSVRPVTQTPPPSTVLGESKAGVKTERIESKEDIKAEAKAFGVRKRKADDGDDEDAVATGESHKKKPWGNTFRKFPGGNGSSGDDIEALLGTVKKVKTEPEPEPEPEIEPRSGGEQTQDGHDPVVKEEDDEPAMGALSGPSDEVTASSGKEEEQREEVPGAGIIFKKRKKAVAPR
ncbi:MAG: hypothetical protein Q9157_002196 [Trypethelium eluteriae]